MLLLRDAEQFFADAEKFFVETRDAQHACEAAEICSTRWDRLPDVPTVREFLPGYETSQWSGIGAPRGTSDAIVYKLNGEINAGLDDPKMKERLAAVGLAGLRISPTEFGRFIADETEKWANVIRAANVKVN